MNNIFIFGQTWLFYSVFEEVVFRNVLTIRKIRNPV